MKIGLCKYLPYCGWVNLAHGRFAIALSFHNRCGFQVGISLGWQDDLVFDLELHDNIEPFLCRRRGVVDGAVRRAERGGVVNWRAS